MSRTATALLFLLTAAITFRFACPTVFADDSAETVVVCFHSDISHPPGDPLLQTAGRLWAELPLGNPALRVNLLSCILASLLAVAMFRICLRVGGKDDTWLVAIAVLVLVLSHPTLRQQAAVAKGAVYMANLLLLCAIATALLSRRLTEAALWSGLLCAHHWMTLAAVSPLLLAAFGCALFSGAGGARRKLAFTLLFLFLSSSLWIVIPVRAIQDPPLNTGGAVTARRFTAHFLRKPFLKTELTADPNAWKRQSLAGVLSLKRGVSFSGLLLAVAGAVSLVHGGAGMLASAGALILCPLLAASFYLDLRPDLLPLLDVFLLPCFLGTAFLIIRGFVFTLRHDRISMRLMALLLLASITFFQARSLRTLDVSRCTFSFDLGRALLAPLPIDAGLVLVSDLDTFPAWYHQYVEGYRPDVMILNRALFRHAWHRDQIADRSGQRHFLAESDHTAAFRQLLTRSERQWFSSPAPIEGTPRGWLRIPHHLTYRLSLWYSRPAKPRAVSPRGILERLHHLPERHAVLATGYMAEALRNLRVSPGMR